MKLLITTQAVDSSDPILGFFHEWIAGLAAHYESIEVICLREGAHALPGNVRVHSLGKEKGAESSFVYAVRFKLLAWRLRHRYDAVFVHMNPEYVVVFGAFWRMLGKRITLWYNHPAANVRLSIAAFFANQIFYTSPYAASARYAKAVQMPVGIDTALFAPQAVTRKPLSIYIQGRVASSKNIRVLLEAVRILCAGGTAAMLTIVGPEDEAYVQKLRSEFTDLIPGVVTFLGPKKNEETPVLYGAHRVAVNLAAAGHFDKSAFEAMACDTPVVVSSKAFDGLVPTEWIVPENDPAALAQTLARALTLPEAEYRALGALERKAVEEHESLAMLIKKIVATMAAPRRTRPARDMLWSILHFFARVLPHAPRITVLFYHSVSDSADFFAVAPREFERQIAYLKKHYEIVPLARAFAHAAGEHVGHDSVAITLDDGYRDFATEVLPILKRYGVPATVFAIAGTPDRGELGNDHPLLTAQDAPLLADQLITLGSHASTHRKLSKMPLEEARQEMTDSRHSLAQQFGKPIDYLAYPKGSYNATVMRAAEEVGYRGAVSVIERSVQAGDSAYALPRIQIDSSVSPALFSTKLTRAADWYYALWSLAKRQKAK